MKWPLSVGSTLQNFAHASRSNFLHFHAFFREIWPNNLRLAPPLGSPESTPLLFLKKIIMVRVITYFSLLMTDQSLQNGHQIPSLTTQGFCSAGAVLVFMNFSLFPPERKETGSLGATESEVWIGDFNVKAWKTIQENEHTPGPGRFNANVGYRYSSSYSVKTSTEILCKPILSHSQYSSRSSSVWISHEDRAKAVAAFVHVFMTI